MPERRCSRATGSAMSERSPAQATGDGCCLRARTDQLAFYATLERQARTLASTRRPASDRLFAASRLLARTAGPGPLATRLTHIASRPVATLSPHERNEVRVLVYAARSERRRDFEAAMAAEAARQCRDQP